MQFVTPLDNRLCSRAAERKTEHNKGNKPPANQQGNASGQAANAQPVMGSYYVAPATNVTGDSYQSSTSSTFLSKLTNPNPFPPKPTQEEQGRRAREGTMLSLWETRAYKNQLPPSTSIPPLLGFPRKSQKIEEQLRWRAASFRVG